MHYRRIFRIWGVSTTLRVLSYLKRYPLLASTQMLCAVIGTLMVIVFPKVTQVIIDEVIPQGQIERLLPLVLISLGAFFARDFLNAMRILVNNVFEQKVIYDQLVFQESGPGNWG